MKSSQTTGKQHHLRGRSLFSPQCVDVDEESSSLPPRCLQEPVQASLEMEHPSPGSASSRPLGLHHHHTTSSSTSSGTSAAAAAAAQPTRPTPFSSVPSPGFRGLAQPGCSLLRSVSRSLRISSSAAEAAPRAAASLRSAHDDGAASSRSPLTRREGDSCHTAAGRGDGSGSV
ncbi:unnamed protein product [Pleuronectes platessa]|uniref:Uncharacterized protein n=1 Tax=Pleuronectes platessa TaxID=8262 RepID=A0A9N7YGE4_PLEPL|nr:unnamed protein product [Pleuronectes platessa]